MSAAQRRQPKNQSNQLIDFFQKRKVVINQKLKRCREFKNDNPPKSYRENTPKEELVLEHVIQFKKQFQQHIGEKRELFLYPKNQCDVYKFICTTIRPTKLGELELYDYKECAQRVSKLIQYEELDPPDDFPQCIPSPANVANWQKGDCFDIAILLTSLLIGVGYNAYVVYGIAPKEITSKNQALMECEFLHDLREKTQQKGAENYSLTKDDSIFPKRVVESAYDKTVVEKERREAEQLAARALTIDDDEPDELTPDLFLGRRLHAWVLLKAGKRGVQKDMFIEPSTGKIYDIKGSPYLLVDAIFNHANFFIHMQPKHKVEEVKFDLYETINWEYVMLHDQLFRSTGEEDGQDLDDHNAKVSDEEEKLKYLTQTLDMPPPWSPKIYVEKEKFLMGTPLGELTSFYARVKVERYADYNQPDGLVLKYILYDDYKKIKVNEIGYHFRHRSDKLIRKYRYPYEFKTVQYYEPSKMPHWKKVTELDRRMRIIEFYPNRNQDGLIRRIEKIGEKTIQIYENRDDRVTTRSAAFIKASSEKAKTPKDCIYEDGHVGRVSITKMTLMMEKDPHMAAHEQIAKMTVDFLKEKVLVWYHMEEGEIEPIKKEYSRDLILGFGKIDTNQKKNDDLLQKEHSSLSNIDKNCFQAIRMNEIRAINEYKNMQSAMVTIDKTLYDKAREKFKDNRNKDDDQIPEEDAKDELRPYLQKRKLHINQPVNTYDLALEIKNQILDKFKQRLVARAKIIQERLQKQREQQKRLEQQYQKKQEEKNQKELSEVKFKIGILQSRSGRFEAVSIQRFQQMDIKISSDPRLAVLKKDRR